jgi:CDGSH-type Zn-finger protein
MARFVKKTAQAPFELTPQSKTVDICMCGLSKHQPFCDGSHMKTKDEDIKKIYVYGDEGSRKEVCDCGSDKKCDCGSACCDGE